jgi:hypothetical protein
MIWQRSSAGTALVSQLGTIGVCTVLLCKSLHSSLAEVPEFYTDFQPWKIANHMLILVSRSNKINNS